MDIDAMREKISPAHKDMLCRMLGLNELPEFLLKRYFAMKKVLDKIDGFLSPTELLRIALDCGLNLETMKFRDGQHTFSKEDVEPDDVLIDDMESEDEPEEELDPEPAEEDFEDVQAEAEEIVIPEKKPRKAKPDIKNGASVTVLHNNKFVCGLVDRAVLMADGEFIYTIELDSGDVVDLMKNDIKVN